MQEIISLWSLWDRYKEDAADTASTAFTAGSNEGGASTSSSTKSHRVGKSTPRPAISSSSVVIPSVIGGTSQDNEGDDDDDVTGQGPGREVGGGGGSDGVGEDMVFVTPAMLSNLLVKMREGCMASILQAGGQSVDAPGTSNIGKAVNKVLERTQTGG